MGILPARILEGVTPCPTAGDLPNPGIEPRSPSLQADYLPAEPQGKPQNTRVGSLSLLQRIFLTQELNWGLLHFRRNLYQLSCQFSSVQLLSRVRLFATPWTIWDSPGQNTGVGSLSLLQGIFPTQGSNPGPPHCRRILYQLSHQVSPGILEWVACPFSRGSSQPRNQTGVSCIAGRFFFFTN